MGSLFESGVAWAVGRPAGAAWWTVLAPVRIFEVGVVRTQVPSQVVVGSGPVCVKGVRVYRCYLKQSFHVPHCVPFTKAIIEKKRRVLWLMVHFQCE